MLYQCTLNKILLKWKTNLFFALEIVTYYQTNHFLRRRAVVQPQPMLLTKVISSARKILALNFKSELTFDVLDITPLKPNNSKHRFVFHSKEEAPVWRQAPLGPIQFSSCTLL
jgi:hypothetical protein